MKRTKKNVCLILIEKTNCFQQDELSWNYISDDDDISPDIDENGNLKSHGTRCAGEIIMQPNNRFCGVGVAYGANIGGKQNMLTSLKPVARREMPGRQTVQCFLVLVG